MRNQLSLASDLLEASLTQAGGAENWRGRHTFGARFKFLALVKG